MSTVTNVILAFSIMEEDHEGILLARVNEYFSANELGRGFVPLASDSLGGTKALECPTFVGAFNCLGLLDFLAHLRTLPWLEPEFVQVFACRQDDECYALFPVF